MRGKCNSVKEENNTLITEKEDAKMLDCEPTWRLEKTERKMLDSIMRGH